MDVVQYQPLLHYGTNQNPRITGKRDPWTVFTDLSKMDTSNRIIKLVRRRFYRSLYPWNWSPLGKYKKAALDLQELQDSLSRPENDKNLL